jgi:hypothetical protein
MDVCLKIQQEFRQLSAGVCKLKFCAHRLKSSSCDILGVLLNTKGDKGDTIALS